MRIVGFGLLVLASCYSSSPSKPADPLSNTAPKPKSLFAMSEAGIGPLDAKTKLSLTGLRTSFAGYDVKAVNDPELSYKVYSKDEELLWVIPNDDGTVFNVHATSPKIVFQRGWSAGEVFNGAQSLSQCECWGTHPTCYKTGAHIAVKLDRACDGLTGVDARALKVLDGVKIESVIWSPKEFGSATPTEDTPLHTHTKTPDPCGGGGDPCGGDPCGGGGDPCGD
jgi:hypothetical protein